MGSEMCIRDSLVSSSKRGKRRLISVVMGAKSPDQRTDISKSLLEYGFRFYETHKIFSPDDKIHTARVYNGEKKELSLTVKETEFISIPRRSLKRIKTNFVIDKGLTAPVKAGENVGFVAIKLDDKVVTRINLYASESIEIGNVYRRSVDSVLKNF